VAEVQRDDRQRRLLGPQRGKKTVLGGMRPIDPNWLRLMGERNLLQYIDAVGVHAFPGTSDGQWEGVGPNVERVRDVLKDFNPAAQVWITETGYSTWRHDERRQLTALVDALDAPVDRSTGTACTTWTRG
jgi:CDP-paratose 2-epimerase